MDTFIPQRHGNNGDIIENMYKVKAESLLLFGKLVGWKDCLKAHKSYEEVVKIWNDQSYEGWLQFARSTWDLSSNATDVPKIEAYLKRAIGLQENNKETEEMKANTPAVCEASRGKHVHVPASARKRGSIIRVA